MIIAVTSWRGVGATTTALLLAVAIADEMPAWLVEADPAGGVLAGRIAFHASEIGGLEQVAFGPGAAPADELFGAVAHERGALRIVSAPADPFRAFACHSPRTAWAALLRDLDGDVVLDAGRLRAGSPAWSLVAAADVVVLTMSPEVSSAVSSAEWLAAGGRVAPGTAALHETPVRLAVVDAPAGVGFPPATLRAELREQWGAWLPWDPDTVDLVHRGALLDDRRCRRRPLASAARELAGSVRESVAVLR